MKDSFRSFGRQLGKGHTANLVEIKVRTRSVPFCSFLLTRVHGTHGSLSLVELTFKKSVVFKPVELITSLDSLCSSDLSFGLQDPLTGG